MVSIWWTMSWLIGQLTAQAWVSVGNLERRERKELDESCCTKEIPGDAVDESDRLSDVWLNHRVRHHMSTTKPKCCKKSAPRIACLTLAMTKIQ